MRTREDRDDVGELFVITLNDKGNAIKPFLLQNGA